jgi:NADPH:quinone reductase
VQALVLTGPSSSSDHTEFREVEDPVPGPGEIIVEVTHAGVNFKDVMQRRGDREWASSWPLIPGMEVAGVVRRLGEGVRSLRVGERVCAYAGIGGLAEVAKVRADLTVPVPDGVGLREAAAVPVVLTTALLLLSDSARLAGGETVLVHSAGGGVGTALACLAPLYGVERLFGTAGHAARLAAVRDAGYERAFVRDADLISAVREESPNGVDVIFDPLGTGWLADNIAMLSLGGRIVLFGNASGGDQALPDLYRLMTANVSIGGMAISAVIEKTPSRVADAMGQILEMMELGHLTYAVTEVPFAEVPDVHQAMVEGSSTGKYVASMATV